jgi:hypothetical protein
MTVLCCPGIGRRDFDKLDLFVEISTRVDFKNCDEFCMEIPFQVIDWKTAERVRHPGETGEAWWQTLSYGGLRVRIVEYSPGYLADHWCQKGHIVHCLEGGFTTELETGERLELKAGMSYIVSDGASSHRSITGTGVKLLIIDGDFLKSS